MLFIGLEELPFWNVRVH